jgi:hypothetical protein
MAQQYADMYQAYDNNRSPGSTRGYPSTLNRQPSRHFENSYGMGQTQGLYTAEDHAARYEGPSRFENRMPSATLHANYQYDTQSWNYGGANGAMGGTGRVKPQTRRAGLPTVSSSYINPSFMIIMRYWGLMNICRSGWIHKCSNSRRTWTATK